MPATATSNRYEELARERKVTDLTNALLRGHAHLLDGAPFVQVVEAALDTACGYSDEQWLTLAEATGRRSISDDTIRLVLARLDGMLPTPVPAGPIFEGLS